jgi:hypothetical protein
LIVYYYCAGAQGSLVRICPIFNYLDYKKEKLLFNTRGIKPSYL